MSSRRVVVVALSALLAVTLGLALNRTPSAAAARPAPSARLCSPARLQIDVWTGGISITSSGLETVVRGIVRVDSLGKGCTLPAGWLRLVSVRRAGMPFAVVRETRRGTAVPVRLSSQTFALARLTLTLPWLLPTGSDCESGVVLGLSLPRSSKVTPTTVITSCQQPAEPVRASVSSFVAVSSKVKDATGRLVADLAPGPIAIGPRGVIYISETSMNEVVERFPDGRFRRVAGTGKAGFTGDGGPATRATLNHPEGLAIGREGVLYIADSGNNRVREVLRSGTIRTVAGDGGRMNTSLPIPVNGSSDGPALRTRIWSPEAVAIGRHGLVYIASSNENAILKVSRGRVRTLVTGRNFGILQRAYNSRICSPFDLALTSRGALFFTCDGGFVLARSPGGRIRIASRATLKWGPYYSIASTSGARVLVLSPGGMTTLSPRGSTTCRFPASLSGIGSISPSNVATGDNMVIVDQGGEGLPLLGGAPPALSRLAGCKLKPIWAADRG